MNVDNILEQISSIRAVPVLCKSPVKEGDIEFDGTVEDFLAFVEQYCHKPVMVWRFVFNERHFLTENAGDGAESEEIDTRTLTPALCRFESYLRTEFSFSLLAWMKETNTAIGFSDYEPWFSEFVAEHQNAEKAYLSEKDDTMFKERDARKKAEQSLMEKLNDLVDDPAFRACKTQRAMYTYATEKIEGLSELREGKVKQAIAMLADKVGLRKH